MSASVTLAAVGDVCLAGYIREHIREAGPTWPFEPCMNLLQADVTFANLECVAFRPGQPEPKSRHMFCASWPEAAGLKQVGFDVLNLANNHILDFGGTVALETIDFCREHGIEPVGLGADQNQARKPAILERAGIRIAVLGYVEDVPGLKRQVSPGPAYIHEPNIVADIAAAKRAGADVVVVSLHADLEFVDLPAPHRVGLSHRLIDAGADIVLEHHPHVPQGIETYNGGLIAYSLGNFVFPVRGSAYMEQGSPWTDKSFVLRIELDRTGYISHQVCPVQITPEGRPEPMPADAATAFMARHERISRDLADPAALQRGWLEIARRYLRININWLVSALQKEGMDHAATEFMQRLLYDENLPWVREVQRDLAARMPPRSWEC